MGLILLIVLVLLLAVLSLRGLTAALGVINPWGLLACC